MERHALVKEFLKPTAEEEKAFFWMILLAWLLPTIVLVTSLVDLLLMYTYLRFLHPFKIIMEDNVAEEVPEVADQVFKAPKPKPKHTPRTPLGG